MFLDFLALSLKMSADKAYSCYSFISIQSLSIIVVVVIELRVVAVL